MDCATIIDDNDNDCEILHLNNEEKQLLHVLEYVNSQPLIINNDDYPYRLTYDYIIEKAVRIFDNNYNEPIQEECWISLHPEYQIKQEQAEQLLCNQQISTDSNADRPEIEPNHHESENTKQSSAATWDILTNKKRKPSTTEANVNSNNNASNLFKPARNDKRSKYKDSKLYDNDSNNNVRNREVNHSESHHLTLQQQYILYLQYYLKLLSNNTESANNPHNHNTLSTAYNCPVLITPTIPNNKPYVLNELPAYIKSRSYAYKVPRLKKGYDNNQFIPLAIANNPPMINSNYPRHTLYFLDSCVRIQDNLSLTLSHWLCNKLNLPLIVMTFALQTNSSTRLTSLSSLRVQLKALNIPLIYMQVDSVSSIIDYLSLWCNNNNTHMLITDDDINSPLYSVKSQLSAQLHHCSVHAIDNENLVPFRYIANEYATDEAQHKQHLSSKLTTTSQDGSTENKSSDHDYTANALVQSLKFELPFPDNINISKLPYELQFPLYRLNISPDSNDNNTITQRTIIEAALSKQLAASAPIDVDNGSSMSTTDYSSYINDNFSLFIPNNFPIIDFDNKINDDTKIVISDIISAIASELIELSYLAPSDTTNSDSAQELKERVFNTLHPLMQICCNNDASNNCLLLSPLRALQLIHHSIYANSSSDNSQLRVVWCICLDILLFSREYQISSKFIQSKIVQNK